MDCLGFLPLPPSPLVSPFPLLTECDGCLDDWVWGLMAGLRGLPAMGVYYSLGAGWSQWRPLGLPGHPFSTQLNAVVNAIIIWQTSFTLLLCILYCLNVIAPSYM